MQQVTLNKKHSINELKQILLNEYPKIIITKESLKLSQLRKFPNINVF